MKKKKFSVGSREDDLGKGKEKLYLGRRRRLGGAAIQCESFKFRAGVFGALGEKCGKKGGWFPGPAEKKTLISGRTTTAPVVRGFRVDQRGAIRSKRCLRRHLKDSQRRR